MVEIRCLSSRITNDDRERRRIVAGLDALPFVSTIRYVLC